MHCIHLLVLLLTLVAHAQRGLQYLVCVCVDCYSHGTGHDMAYEWHQQLQCYRCLKNKTETATFELENWQSVLLTKLPNLLNGITHAYLYAYVAAHALGKEIQHKTWAYATSSLLVQHIMEAILKGQVVDPALHLSLPMHAASLRSSDN